MKNKKVIIIVAVILVIILILGSIGFYIFLKSKNNVPQDDGNGNIGVSVLIGNTDAPVVESSEEGRSLQKEIEELHTTYPEAVAWLKVPGTSIDTPVFQAADNEKYLKNDRDGNSTKWGEEFLDYRCNIDNTTDKSHFIVYGHNTKSDDNFTPLLNYKNEEFLKNHGIIEFSTLNGNYRWQIFSVYVTNTEFFYIDTSFEDAIEFSQFIFTLESKSMYDTGTEIYGDETILTLSTCDYSLSDGRFVVQAKLITE